MSGNEQIKNTEAIITPNTETVVSAKMDWRKVLDKISYRGIVNNVPFLTFIVLLGVFYIANKNAAVETQRELDKQQKVLKELNWRNMDAKSKLTNAGMEAEIIRRGAIIGMKPLMIPPYKIVVDSTPKTNKK
ncbi:MAG: FtsL-like putative cell division protein [Phycisphaerales bacterium]|nr:FtsL-like putative cell division protein [Phycisphaerales bacterium]